MLKPSRAQRKTAQRKHAVTFWWFTSFTTSPSDPDAAWRRLSHRFVSGSRDAASEPRRLETTYESRPSAPFHTCGNVVTRRSPVRCTQSVSYIGPGRKAQGASLLAKELATLSQFGQSRMSASCISNVPVVELETPLLRGQREHQDTFSKDAGPRESPRNRFRDSPTTCPHCTQLKRLVRRSINPHSSWKITRNRKFLMGQSQGAMPSSHARCASAITGLKIIIGKIRIHASLVGRCITIPWPEGKESRKQPESEIRTPLRPK